MTVERGFFVFFNFMCLSVFREPNLYTRESVIQPLRKPKAKVVVLHLSASHICVPVRELVIDTTEGIYFTVMNNFIKAAVLLLKYGML